MKTQLLLSCLLFFSSVTAQANPLENLWDWDELGFFSSVDDDTSAGEYTQNEWYAIRDLNWQGTTAWGINYESSLFAGGGWYEQETDKLEYLTVGPVMRLSRGESPVKLELGIRPGILFDSTSPGRDFGGTFTFFDHIGLMWKPTKEVTVGYRFQHMSNGSLYETNPGINMHLLDVRVGWQ